MTYENVWDKLLVSIHVDSLQTHKLYLSEIYSSNNNLMTDALQVDLDALSGCGYGSKDISRAFLFEDAQAWVQSWSSDWGKAQLGRYGHMSSVYLRIVAPNHTQQDMILCWSKDHSDSLTSIE